MTNDASPSARINDIPSELLAEAFLIAAHSITSKPPKPISRFHFAAKEEAAELLDRQRRDTVFIEPQLDQEPYTFTRVCK